jgi:hypothetical protein
MQIRDLSKPITAKTLNESLASKFGYKLNLEQFTEAQLEDARNKLRTKLSQIELGESFDSISESPEYQKTRVMLDCINQELLEREIRETEGADNEGEMIQQESDDGRIKKIYFDAMTKKAMEYSVPESWINSAIRRIDLGESDQAELAAELTTRYDLNEELAEHIVYLKEGESEKAEIIMSTKDMVERVTGWIEDVSAMKSEQLLELLDSIRENLGSDVAQRYQSAIKPALEGIYAALEQGRQGLSNGLAAVSGGQPDMMGADAGGMGGMGDMGGDMAGMAPMGADAGAEMAPPAEGTVGREKRESIDYSRRLGMLLAAKKK